MTDHPRRIPPIVLTDVEIQALLVALGDGNACLPPDRPDLMSAFVRAKRALRRAPPAKP